MSEGTPPPDSPRSPRGFVAALWVLAVAAFAFFQWGTWRQYLDGRVRGDSVQVFNTMLSRFAAGEGMIHVHSGNHFFKNHVMLWLYPVGWLYKAFDSLFTYLTPMNVALAAAVVPLGMLAYQRTRCQIVSLGVCVLYILSNLTASLRLSVHPESLLIPGWFLIFLGVELRKRLLVACGIAIIFSVKEDSAVWLGVYAAWLLAFRVVGRRAGLILLGVAVSAFLLFKLVMFGIPLTGEDKDIGYFWLARFGDVASTPGELGVWFLTHPHVVLGRVFINPTWIVILLGGGLICLLGWRESLLLLPPAFFLFSAVADEFRYGLYYYLYPFLPPLFLALIAGCKVLIDRYGVHRATRRLLAGFLVLMAGVQLFIPTRVDGWMQFPPAVPLAERTRLEVARSLVQRAVPRDQSTLQAAVHYDLNQWVPRGRQLLFLRDKDLAVADVMLLDTRRVSSDLGREKYLELLDRLQAPDSEWRVDEEVDGLVLLRRKDR